MAGIARPDLFVPTAAKCSGRPAWATGHKAVFSVWNSTAMSGQERQRIRPVCTTRICLQAGGTCSFSWEGFRQRRSVSCQEENIASPTKTCKIMLHYVLSLKGGGRQLVPQQGAGSRWIYWDAAVLPVVIQKNRIALFSLPHAWQRLLVLSGQRDSTHTASSSLVRVVTAVYNSASHHGRFLLQREKRLLGFSPFVGVCSCSSLKAGICGSTPTAFAQDRRTLVLISLCNPRLSLRLWGCCCV